MNAVQFGTPKAESAHRQVLAFFIFIPEIGRLFFNTLYSCDWSKLSELLKFKLKYIVVSLQKNSIKTSWNYLN